MMFAGIASDDIKARVKALAARVKAHDETVAKANEKANEPELREYNGRWDAYKDKVTAVQRRLEETLSWVSDHEVTMLEGDLKILLIQWDTLAAKISLRKNDDIIETLESVKLKKTQGKDMSLDEAAILKEQFDRKDAGLTPGADVRIPRSSASGTTFSDYLSEAKKNAGPWLDISVGSDNPFALLKGVGVGMGVAILLGIGLAVGRRV